MKAQPKTLCTECSHAAIQGSRTKSRKMRVEKPVSTRKQFAQAGGNVFSTTGDVPSITRASMNGEGKSKKSGLEWQRNDACLAPAASSLAPEVDARKRERYEENPQARNLAQKVHLRSVDAPPPAPVRP